MRIRHPRTLLGALLATGLLLAACATDDETGGSGSGDLADPGDCIVVDMAVSPEKIELLQDLARTFNTSDDARLDDDCIFVRPQVKSSGGAAQLLAGGWDETTEGPRPVIWSPAASTWGAVLNQQLVDQGEQPIAPADSESFMLTPLVVAMPEPMAEALGYPEEPVGWDDVLRLANDPDGWAAFGHPEWGSFRLGKTNPNFSTSGLAALIAQAYAATGKTEGLTAEDLDRPEVQAFGAGVESAVVHYGDTTLTFLDNLYRADQRGTALSYASAVAVEEKSVIDYNSGNPDGVLDPGEEPRPPRVPLVAIYPEEGTIFSDNPFLVLDADWVSDEQADAAARFTDFVQEPENQERVLEYGFRPANPEVAIAEPIVAANGVDPDQPQTLLEVPDPAVMVDLLDRWDVQRKKARVLLVVDVSGSMGDPGDLGTGETKLELAQRAAIDALDEFSPQDEVGLIAFSTNLGPDQDQELLELVAPGPVAEVRDDLEREIAGLVPTNGTPLYTAVQTAYEDALAAFDEDRINAVVVLSDGQNDDGNSADDDQQLAELVETLQAGSEGQASRPVRVFPIAYGADASLAVLGEIAEASSAAVYDAGDPASITKVFTAVVSNF